METNGLRQGAGVIEAKRGIRQQVKSARQGLSASYRETASRRIRQHVLLWLESHSAGTVFCYVSDDREPDTRPLMEELLSRGIRVCVPRCCSGGVMEAVPVPSLSVLVPGRFGIPEPGEELPSTPADRVDVCIVPCLSAGRDGGRLGHGMGYYDRWLAGFKGTALCLCFDALRRENLPMEETDRPMDALVTEEGVFACGTCPMETE